MSDSSEKTSARSQAIFLTAESPYPANGGAKIRDSNLIRVLSERFDVEVLCFRQEDSSERISDSIHVRGVRRKKAPLWKRSIYPLRPYVVNGYCERMEHAIREQAAPGKILWISRLALAQYIPLARSLGYRVVLDEHNVESNLLMNSALSSLRQLPNLWIAAQCSYYESRFCKQSHAVVATSDIDASKLVRIAGDVPVHVVPNMVDASVFEGLRGQEGTTLFFSGTLSYAPNVEGLEWFIAEILPRLRRSMGERLPRIVVAGSNPSPEMTQMLGSAKIELYVNPPSMLPFLGDAAVVFVPLRSGSGTRLKILEAMAAGKAVVSTGKGAEGLILSPTYDVWIADSEDRFTSAIIHLLEDSKLRKDLGAHAAETIHARYDWKCGRTLINSVLSGLPQ